MAFDHLKVAEKLRKSNTGHDTLKLILENPDGSSHSYENWEEVVRHLEINGKSGTADKIRALFNRPKQHERKDKKSVGIEKMFDRHKEIAKAETEASKT